MKIAVLVLALVAVATATVVHTKSARKVADGEFLKRQKAILSLFYGIGHENTYTGEHADFDFFGHSEYFTNPEALREFVYAYKHGFLPRDGVFTLTCKRTRYQTMKLFDVFYFAKDFETFHKIASWARAHLNGPQFAYALYVAVYHRPDCHGIHMPSLYEVFPHGFVTTEIMHKFYDAKMEGNTEYKAYLNNSGWEDYYHGKMYDGVLYRPYDTYYQHTEERLSYFREDVGLNDYLAQFFVFYPTWLNQEKYSQIQYFRRGELYYYVFQQLFARYALERYANHLPKTEVLVWDKPIKVGYNPKITTFNGHALFPRGDGMTPKYYNPITVKKVEAYERRIYDSIDAARFYAEKNHSWVQTDNKNGIDVAGNVVFGSADSVAHRYYQTYFFKGLEAIGYMVKTSSDREFVPGAMGSIWTAARDPAFYNFLHRMIKIFQHHKHYLPHYTQKELGYQGVRIESFDVEKLVTYFDRYDFEVTNAVPIPKGESKTYKDYHYVAKQHRLNHKPFTYKLTVTSDKSTDAMVRVFIGPKHDSEGHELTIEQARMAFVEFDRFPVKMTSGQNVYERNSKESPVYVQDHESFRSYYKRVKDAMQKQEPFYVTESFKCGMPSRFMLPKGWKSGQPFVMYAIVTPYEEKYTPAPAERYFDTYVTCGGSKYYDFKPYGFPFDRVVPYDQEFHLPNMHFKDVLVYHKEEAEVNRV